MPSGLDAGLAGVAFSGAHAVLREGFYAQLAASAGLVICGAALSLDLRPVRAEARRPSRRRTRRAGPGIRRRPPWRRRHVSERLRLERLLPFACLAGAGLLIASELMDTFRFDAVDELTGKPARSPPADRHHYAMLVLGGFAIIALAVASSPARSPPRSRSRSPAARHLLFVLIDVPTPARSGPSATPACPSSTPRRFPRAASGWR